MSGAGLFVWMAEQVALEEVLPSLGWSHEPSANGSFEKEGREWWARAMPCRPVFEEDVPEAVADSLPGIAWLVELFYEGRARAADQVLSRAANAIASKGHGVISDEEKVWTPRGIRRAKTISHQEVTPPQMILMTWWAAGGPLFTREGVDALVNTLERFLPEALPDRWDVVEPPSHRLSVEGSEGLVEFLDNDRSSLKFLWPRKPVYQLGIDVNWWGKAFPYFHALYFHIGIDAALVLQPGWPRQLPRAFREVSRVIQPFYGEARPYPDLSRGLVEGRPQPNPASTIGGGWCGVPQHPPLAMVVGAPYLENWPTAQSGAPLDGLMIHSSDVWPQLPLGGCPRPPPTIAQERDATVAMLTPDEWPERDRARRARNARAGMPFPDRSIRFPIYFRPERKPPFWPFSDEQIRP
jgi:hypothetical protein